MQARAILDDLPRYTKIARAYLLSTEVGEDLNRNAEQLRAYGIDRFNNSYFVLELINPTGDESVYRVEFKDGAPVGWCMDH
jgi:hypothetical protein